MTRSLVRTPWAGALALALMAPFGPALAHAKISPEAQKKTRAKAQEFEAMFLNSMFSQMTTGVKGEGPFGDTTGTGVWRSMLTDEYSKSFAKSGGIGISNDVFRTLILQQANRAG